MRLPLPQNTKLTQNLITLRNVTSGVCYVATWLRVGCSNKNTAGHQSVPPFLPLLQSIHLSIDVSIDVSLCLPLYQGDVDVADTFHKVFRVQIAELVKNFCQQLLHYSCSRSTTAMPPFHSLHCLLSCFFLVTPCSYKNS